MEQTDTFIDVRHDGTVYRLDVGWLLSNYNCIYGRGCKSAFPGHTQPVHGCCTIGAHYQSEDDVQNTRDVLARLDPSYFTNGDLIYGPDGVAHDKNWLTTLVDDICEDMKWYQKLWYKFRHRKDEVEMKTKVAGKACIFANDDDSPAGGGCGFHHAAIAHGEDYQPWKPLVCSWVPMYMIELDENQELQLDEPVIVVTRYENRYWSNDGDEEFSDWWCMDAEEAYSASKPVYVTMEKEIRLMLGDAVYEKIKAVLDPYMNQVGSKHTGVPVSISNRRGSGYAHRVLEEKPELATRDDLAKWPDLLDDKDG